jgi:hypothetical protein
MPIYLYRLVPPRPAFPSDMTPAEAGAMERHFAYWGEQISRGAVVVFGPVADPAGTYGIAVMNVPSQSEARDICANDPAVTAKLGFTFGLYEMPNAVIAGDLT